MKQLVTFVFVVLIAVNPSCKFRRDKGYIGKRTDTMAVWQANRDSIMVVDSKRQIQERLPALENAKLDSIKEADQVKLDVNIKRELGKISELLFGHNIEHTRSCVYQGLSAQMIRNRKFAGNPYPITGQAMEWYTIGSEDAFFLLDDSNGYTRHYDRGSRNNEINCQRIQLYIDGKICGIGQDKLALEENKKYEVRIVLKGSEKIPVNIRLKSGSSSKGYYEKNVRLDSTGTWQKFIFEFTSPCTDKNACIEITYTCKAELAIGSVSLLPSDNFYGMRSDVIELLKEIGTPILRWPGGSFANVYLWKDGLLDVDMRAPIWSGMNQANTGGYDFSEIGIDEFIFLCRELNAEPFISVNLEDNGSQGSASWVEYCNGGSGSPWGSIRTQHGNREPFNVKYWALGNEWGWSKRRGLHDPSIYAETSIAFAKVMKEIDPSIFLVSAGIWVEEQQITRMRLEGCEGWYTECLAALSPYIDHISHHNYASVIFNNRSAYFPVFYSDEMANESFSKTVAFPYKDLEGFKEIRENINSCVKNGKFIGISFDEWNVWDAWYRYPGVVEGIYVANMLNMLCREANNTGVRIGIYFEPVNEGAIVVNPYTSRLTPAGQIFSLFKSHHGNTLVHSTGYDASNCIDITASINEDSKVLVVTIINSSPTENKNISVNFEGINHLRLLNESLLFSENFFPGTIFEKRQIDDLVINDDPSVAFTLPKHSVAKLEFKIR